MMGSPVLPLRMLLMQQSNREKMWILDLHTRIYILRDWYSYLRNDVLGSKSRSCLHDKTFESGTLFDFTMPSLSSV